MFVKRLEILADHLDNVHERIQAGKHKRAFSLLSWLYKPNPSISECGTHACAVGEATFIPAFRKLGLRLARLDDVSTVLLPRYKKLWSWTAVQKFFGLDYRTAAHLFSVSSYDATGSETTAKQVANRIRFTVAKHRSS